MSAVSATYILYAEEGFRLGANIAYPIGIVFAVACVVIFILKALVPVTMKNK